MKITHDNRKELDKLYFHDSIFAGFSYDYQSKEISLRLEMKKQNIVYRLVFSNVILLHLQSCEFWGGGNAVYWIESLDSYLPLEQLKKRQREDPDSFQYSRLDNDIDYLSVKITLNTGDTILVCCESMSVISVTGDGLKPLGQGTEECPE